MMWSDPCLEGLELLYAKYSRHHFSSHSHDTYSIASVLKGRFSIRQGSSATIGAHDILIIPPGETHAGGCVGDEGCTYRMYYPSVAMISELVSQVTGQENRIPNFPLIIKNDRRLAEALYSTHKTLQTSDPSLLERETIVSQVFSKLIVRHAEGVASSKRNFVESKHVHRLKRILEDRYSENLNLKDLANEVGLSPFHLLRTFKAATGKTPYFYLTNIRLGKAKSFLKKDMPIAQVAYETGFTDQSQFSKRFRAIVGLTPGQYQRSSNNPQY